MQPENNKIQPTQTIKSFHLKNYVFIILGAVILALAGVGAYYAYSQRSSNKSVPVTYIKGLHNEDYSKLEPFKLDGQSQSSGISFLKPVDYQLALTSAKKDQVSFANSLKKPVFAPLGALHVAIVPVSSTVSKTYLNYLNTTLESPKGNNYKAVIAPVEQFVAQRFSPLYDITYAPAVKLTNANLNGNAWTFGLSATPKKTASPAQPSSTKAPISSAAKAPFDTSKAAPVPTGKTAPAMEKYKGLAVLIVGKNTYYYFYIYNTDYNWNNNQSVWQKIVDSIKVDQ